MLRHLVADGWTTCRIVKLRNSKENSQKLFPKISHTAGVLTQGAKNSNSRKNFLKLKHFWLQNSRNRQIGGNFCSITRKSNKIWRFLTKIVKFSQKLKQFWKLKPEICQKLKKSAIPEILCRHKNGLKKAWFICHKDLQPCKEVSWIN